MARVLLADDDAAMRDLVKRALEIDGHAVVSADDGADAQSTLSSGDAFDVIVTDIQMPGIDGLTLARSALAANTKLKVVLMSAHTDLLETGALDPARVRLVAKPFTIDHIRTEVRGLLGG